MQYNVIIYAISERVPNVSFTQAMYSVREDEEVLTVSVERSGDSDSHVMVLIATHPSEGTATGQCVVYVIIIAVMILNKLDF